MSDKSRVKRLTHCFRRRSSLSRAAILPTSRFIVCILSAITSAGNLFIIIDHYWDLKLTPVPSIHNP